MGFPLKEGRRRRGARAFLALAALLTPAAASGQATGRILGIVRDASSEAPIVGASVRLLDARAQALTDAEGRFVLAAVPPGDHTLRVEQIGYQATTLEHVTVHAGEPAILSLTLTATPLDVEPLVVQAERGRLIEPDVTRSHTIVAGEQLRELPLDRVDEAIELAPGVSDGHFRGGRVGQETYVVDGLALKDQLSGSEEGTALELSPTSLEEVDVVTGGFGAEQGTLSGVVNLVTRRGDPDRWTGRSTLLTDAWAPSSMYHGYTGLSASVGGPVGFVGDGSTLFVDVLAQGEGDADPRARGLTCVRQDDVSAELEPLVASLRADAPALYCPYTADALPNQRGDKVIGFARLDRPFGRDLSLTTSLLYNRAQQELYTPELKYQDSHSLGTRSDGALFQAALDYVTHGSGSANHYTARLGLMQLDRQIGVIDPAWADGRAGLGPFSFGSYRFLGEDFVHEPIEDQLRSGRAVPGYVAPSAGVGSPFGPAAEGIFVTEGTSGIASWSQTRFLAADLVGEHLAGDGSAFRAGATGRFYAIQSYERVQAYLPASSLDYARFYPATLAAFADFRQVISHEFEFQFGMRTELFRSGVTASEDRADYLAPEIDASWKATLLPRVGVSGLVPGTDDRVSFRFSYSRVAQPPDFQYFLDTALGDSLRTDVKRQGNPNLGFERGHSFELGMGAIVTPRIGVSVTGYRKQLDRLVTGSLDFGGTETGQFNTGDNGTVQGLEFTVDADLRLARLKGSYTLQKAEGLGGDVFGDSVANPTTAEPFPLPFDQRHAIDAALFLGRAGGVEDAPWSFALTATAHSGYPFDRRRAAGGGAVDSAGSAPYLPWTAVLDGRASLDLGTLPGCGHCAWRVTVDGRNLLGRANVVALRHDSGTLSPTLATVQDLADQVELDEPIPRESSRYAPAVDLDSDGLITVAEFRTARQAAALDRQDPSIYYGEARQVRLGVEVAF